jgi:chitinase
MDLLKSTFYCGTSIDQIDGDCENAIPCPTGDECPEGYGCFAFSQCGGIDIESLVDTFGDTERPTRAPTVPIEQVCDEQRKMSVNVGYWQSWSIYRKEDCQRMDTSTFDAAPYTHVVYSFASIDSSYRLEAWNGTYDNEVPLYKEFNTVKQRHPGTKTMIAVGGWTHNDPGPMQKRFSQMASSKSNRQTFASSVVQFMRTYGFDGLDLDWEYPGLKERGGKREDYDNYVLMTKELREAFNDAPEQFELTVAITGNITKLEMGFDLAGLAKYIDWFNIMAYDLWGSWDPQQVAYSHTDLRMIDEAVEYMSHFIQRDKLVLGLGSYARTYNLVDEDCLELGCPFDGPGAAGCEGTDGFLPYFEVADLITSRNYDYVKFDEDSQSMVMVTDGTRLISYDNTVSFNRKIEYAEEMCFMGDMLWAIDMLKDGSNPLSSNNGNSLATGDPSDQSFCGKTYQDVISGCKQPCTSGDSDQCAPGEFCFANTGCSIDSIGAPPPTKCRLCPDPSTQGMKDWLEVDYDGDTMSCSDADMAVISEFAKGSEECDAAKQSLGSTCCYTYADNPCMLCRSETEFMDLRALAELEYDGEPMTCFDLSRRLGPEESDSQQCRSAQKEHWDTCCYNQCTLCQGQGVKWWNEVEYDDETLNCGELDAKLYSDETKEESEECKEVLDQFVGECCFDYPTDPCDVCTIDGKRQTLVPNGEIEYDGATFTCAEVNNFLSPFESSAKQCSEVKGLASDTCCFDRCSLCGEGARLDPEILVELEDGEQGTCADIESGLFQERVVDSSEECTMARTLHYDACCFEIPSSPCQLCAHDEYMHFTTTIEFNDEEVTCRSASNYLQEREDSSSNTCSDAKASLVETCCYSICNICGDYSLDWDVFVNFDGKDMSCGDFNEIFREEAVVDGSEQCEDLKSDYYDTCCYQSPTTSCQLCKQGDKFFDLNDNVEVDFNGPTTCFEVANFLSRRTSESEPVCGVTQTSLFDECCYEKCNLADKPGTYPDWSAEVEMNGNKATCLELENAIKEAAISKDTTECQTLQDAFSPICSYSIPQNACDICPDNAVSIEASAEWNGKEMKCSDIKSRISAREESTSDVCMEAQNTLQDSCCFDQCEICDRSEKTDFVLTVYHEGQTKQCTEVDTYFYEKSVPASSEECTATKSEHSGCCFTEPETPCNLCKRDTEYFDIMGTNSVSYMNQKMTCSDLSDMMFRREEEDGETCSSAKDEFFDACCDTKCSLCAGKGLEAGVKISYEGRMTTCLEVDLGLGPAAIIAGSDQCNEIVSQHSADCCFDKPEVPCRICPGDNVGVDKDASVMYLGTETTCESLSNYLGSREEQQGDACQAAASDHSQDCCYERCSLCEGGKADWETFVMYEGQSISCGDFEWILRGKNVEAGSDTCNAVKDEFHGKVRQCVGPQAYFGPNGQSSLAICPPFSAASNRQKRRATCVTLTGTISMSTLMCRLITKAHR